ncbi:MAG: DedA family protein [Culicoidibacterales bacterium]
METFILHMIETFGYFGVFILITIENIFPPIPSEIILTFGGFLTTYTELTIPIMILVATCGSLLGALLLYTIGYYFRQNKLEILFENKFFTSLGFRSTDVTRSVLWFEKIGNKAVFFGRFIPIIRSLISIPAGVTQMKLLPFIFYTTVGSIIWNTALIGLGAFMGNAWNIVAESVGLYAQIVLIILLIITAIVLIIFIKQRKLDR